ncbi:hypothetical protein NMG60_11015266 [Bertholletia excelsa]
MYPSSSSYLTHPAMSITGIQGHMLEITVVGCTKLKDTEWISRQDPYVCVEYGSSKFRTRTCTDGGKNPTFQEKFNISLIEGLREVNVIVWNSNSITYDDFIGSGKVQLQKVLSEGYDDSSWTLQTKTGRYAGEVRLILHYANAKKPATTNYAPSAPPYVAPICQPPLTSMAPHVPVATAYQPHSLFPGYPSSAAYPPAPYPHPQASAYTPTYPTTSVYPPPPYPPPPQTSPYYPLGPGPHPGAYPRPPY